MSRSRRFAGLASALFALAAPPAARAEMVAGWDFSQYLGDGTLVVDDGSLFQFVDTLDANYSNLDETYNLGPDSAQYGTMYIDGSFGSTAVPAGTAGAEQLLPIAILGAADGSLFSNLDAPVEQFGDNAFDSLELLALEGQVNQVRLGMTALADVDVVFAADRGTPAAGNWILSFGAKTQAGTATAGVQVSPTGAGYASVGSVNLTTTDTRYTVDLGPVAGAATFARLSFNVTAPNFPIFDNVAISVPEPDAAAQLAAAGAALVACARRRRRA